MEWRKGEKGQEKRASDCEGEGLLLRLKFKCD